MQAGSMGGKQLLHAGQRTEILLARQQHECRAVIDVQPALLLAGRAVGLDAAAAVTRQDGELFLLCPDSHQRRFSHFAVVPACLC